MAKHSVLKLARGLNQPFRPVEIADLDGNYHAFIVRYSGDYIAHAHDRDEFVYVLEGAVTFEIGGKAEEVRQGEAILIPAGTRHRPRCKSTALGMVIETKGLQNQMEPQV
ncbi:MAG: cupin domain-containing protein [Krumholzibacteria bacterium]|nr:cupin domain-containing protein [Candidatus Krumholzibacteria bacterium]